MRTHRTHEIIAPWSTGAAAQLDPARLAAVRIEPVLRQRRPALALDLYFAGEDGDTIVPLVLADPSAVVERDRDPLIWPHGTPADDATAAAVAARILPHLTRLVLGGERILEHVVEIAAAPRFAAARAAGCFGAAPLRDSLGRLAPYAYARRFARGRSVTIDAPDAYGGWALLRPIATAGIAAARHDAAGAAWYGEAPRAGARSDVAILAPGIDAGDAAWVLRLDGGGAAAVTVADPVPLDTGIVFDATESTPRRVFAIERAPEPPVRALPDLTYQAAGGSAGRIAVVLGRADAFALPGADLDEARALVDALRAEGFDATLEDGAEPPGGVDLIHLIGTSDGRRARAVVDAARRAGVAVAVHAHDEDAAAGGWWGAAVTRFCFEYGADERDVARYLELLAKRAVSVGAAQAGGPFAPAEAAVEDAAAALREASIVFAATEEEAAVLRARTGRRGPLAVVAPLAAFAAAAPVGHLTGPDAFALVHAPIGPSANQLLVARCAAVASIPLIVAGPVADASYLERVREFGGPGLVVLPEEPSPGVAAALRAAAAVVVDAAWIGEGGSRLAAAALAGTRLAVADRRRFAPPGTSAHRFDPGDAAALTRALGEAWDEARRVPPRAAAETLAALAPGATVRAIVRGYASIPA